MCVLFFFHKGVENLYKYPFFSDLMSWNLIFNVSYYVILLPSKRALYHKTLEKSRAKIHFENWHTIIPQHNFTVMSMGFVDYNTL